MFKVKDRRQKRINGIMVASAVEHRQWITFQRGLKDFLGYCEYGCITAIEIGTPYTEFHEFSGPDELMNVEYVDVEINIYEKGTMD